jgi:hypothetical protein
MSQGWGDLPVGAPLDWTAAARPAHTQLRGTQILLCPLDAERDAEPLYAVSHPPDGDPRIWTYLPDRGLRNRRPRRALLANELEADLALLAA